MGSDLFKKDIAKGVEKRPIDNRPQVLSLLPHTGMSEGCSVLEGVVDELGAGAGFEPGGVFEVDGFAPGARRVTLNQGGPTFEPQSLLLGDHRSAGRSLAFC